jgi:hypothetical protein
MKKTAAALTLVLAFLPATFLSIFEVCAQTYPYNPVYRDVAPPEGAEAPIVTIHTPRNSSSYPKNVTLTFYVTLPKTNDDKSIDGLAKIYYRSSWENKEIAFAPGVLGGSIDLSDAPGGNLSVTIYAVGVGYVETGSDDEHTYYDRFEITGYSTVSFFKDLVPPRITVLSPLNTTYASSEIELDFTVSEAVSQILYGLDGKENQTIAGNTTLTGLVNGEHTVTLYVADLAGNAASSKTLFFTVSSPAFPIVPVAVTTVISSILLCVGLLVYFKKRHREKILCGKLS